MNNGDEQYVYNSKTRLIQLMGKHKKPEWLPSSEDVRLFELIATALFAWDPMYIKMALESVFSVEDIQWEYDIEAADILHRRGEWSDVAGLAKVIKEVMDQYFGEDVSLKDCIRISEEVLLVVINDSAVLSMSNISVACNRQRSRLIRIL